MEFDEEESYPVIDRDYIRKELARIVIQIQYKSQRANRLAKNLRELVLYCECNKENKFLEFLLGNDLVRVCNICGRINILHTIEKEEYSVFK
ncbi:MAG: hypothetical protein ACFFDW_09520 [Candidatus Thorarchaeota archaeon]